MANAFGHFIKERRLSLNLGLREFCESAKLDPSNYSKYERGTLAPPDGKILHRIGVTLGLAPRSPAWARFEDLAAHGRGEVPTDIQEKYHELLPALYQRLRDHDVEDGISLKELAEFLKRNA